MKTCSFCKKEKQESEFGRDLYKKDGKRSRCKECIKETYSDRIIPRKESGSKSCMHCKIEKDFIEFGNNRANFDGMHFWCKECCRKKAKEYRLKYPENYEREKHKKFISWRESLGIDPSVKLKNKKGQGYISKQGYLSYHKDGHPCADKNGRVQASHLVIYEHTGRILKKGESIHHKNGMRLDNSIENLEVWTTSQPAGQRVDDKINWCKEFLEEYGYIVHKGE
jgi:hypothetical protein